MVRKLTIPSLVNHILIAQWFVTLCFAGVLFVIKRELAFSALLGGIICVLPNYYFARQMFTKCRTADPQRLMWSVYIAEFIKLSLAVALFAVVFINYKELHPLTLLITYFIAQSCMWFIPLLRPNTSEQHHKQII